MLNEFDYDEEAMKESIITILVPQMITPDVSPRLSTSQQDAIFFDLQRLIEDERLR